MVERTTSCRLLSRPDRTFTARQSRVPLHSMLRNSIACEEPVLPFHKKHALRYATHCSFLPRSLGQRLLTDI